MNTRKWTLVGVAYALIACGTYGHAWSHVRPFPANTGMHSESRFILSLAAAGVWPAYFAVIIFDKGETS